MIKLIDLLREDADYESQSGDTASMGNINEKNVDANQRKVYLKAAIEMAQAYTKRGYTQEEAINDAAMGIKRVYGYELTDKDKQAVKHFVPEHGSFK